MNRQQRRAEEVRIRRDQKAMQAYRRQQAKPTRSASMAGIVVIGIILFYASLAVLWFTQPSHAHSWYDTACCSGNDCAAAPVGSVLATRDGWLVEIPPNGHPSIGPEGWTGLFPYDSPKLKESQDGQFHVCIGPNTKAAFCLYVPKGSPGV